MSIDKRRAKNHATLAKMASMEPVLTEENFRSDLHEFLNFHSMFSQNKEFNKWALQFARKHRKDLVETFKQASDFELKYIAIFTRAKERGDYLDEKTEKFLEDTIKNLVIKYSQPLKKSIMDPKKADDKPTVKRDPQFYIDQKARTVAGEIDGAIDDFLADGTEFNTRAYLESQECSVPVANKIVGMYTVQLKEIEEVIEGKDEQLVEGYSNFTKRKLKAFAKFLQSIIDDASQFVQTNKAPVRRRKKTVPPSKVVARVQFLKEFKELNLKSVEPVKLVDCNEVWLYNTKYRRITVYKSDGGMTVRGTTLVGFDVIKSKTQTIRDPEKFFKGLSLGKRALSNAIKTITTKAIKPNGRINKDTIILGAF